MIDRVSVRPVNGPVSTEQRSIDTRLLSSFESRHFSDQAEGAQKGGPS